MDPILGNNTLKLVTQIVYMLIPRGVWGNAGDFFGGSQGYSLYVVAMTTYDAAVLQDKCVAL